MVCETTAWAKTQPVQKSWMKRAKKISFDLRAGITGLRPSKGALVTWTKTQHHKSAMDAAEAGLVSGVLLDCVREMRRGDGKQE